MIRRPPRSTLFPKRPLFRSNGGDDQSSGGDETAFSPGPQNILGTCDATATQSATATASATGGDNAVAVAEIDQSQDISVTQTNRSFNNVWFHWWWS